MYLYGRVACKSCTFTQELFFAQFLPGCAVGDVYIGRPQPGGQGIDGGDGTCPTRQSTAPRYDSLPTPRGQPGFKVAGGGRNRFPADPLWQPFLIATRTRLPHGRPN